MSNPNNTISFSDWLKNLVLSKAHSGICQCQRQFGTINSTEFITRLLSPKVHCPRCGSGWLMGHKGARIQVSLGDFVIDSAGKTCRSCNNIFHEYEVFTSCKADPPKAAIKHQQKLEKVNNVAENLGFKGIDDFKAKLLELRSKRS